jgi:hypothetical protein
MTCNERAETSVIPASQQILIRCHDLVSVALAVRKVQPPFYQYNELKIATGGFHKDNKLGHGSFGVVYKVRINFHLPAANPTHYLKESNLRSHSGVTLRGAIHLCIALNIFPSVIKAKYSRQEEANRESNLSLK